MTNIQYMIHQYIQHTSIEELISLESGLIVSSYVVVSYASYNEAEVERALRFIYSGKILLPSNGQHC